MHTRRIQMVIRIAMVMAMRKRRRRKIIISLWRRDGVGWDGAERIGIIHIDIRVYLCSG